MKLYLKAPKIVSDTLFATLCCIAWYQSKHWSSKLDLYNQSTITLDPKPLKPPQTHHLWQSTIQQAPIVTSVIRSLKSHNLTSHPLWTQSSEASNHTIWTPQAQATTINNKIQTSKFVKPIQHTENRVRPTHWTNRSK